MDNSNRLIHTDNQSHSHAKLRAIAKPLALMVLLLSVSSDALAVRPCTPAERVEAAKTCEGTVTSELRTCTVTAVGTWRECCVPGTDTCKWNSGTQSSDGSTLPEDEERDDPFDSSSTPDDEDDMVDREFDTDDDGELRDDDGDTDEDLDTGMDDEDFDTGMDDGISADDDEAQSDEDDVADTESEASNTATGCSTVGQTQGGLVALILGALLGLTRRQVRWN